MAAIYQMEFLGKCAMFSGFIWPVPHNYREIIPGKWRPRYPLYHPLIACYCLYKVAGVVINQPAERGRHRVFVLGKILIDCAACNPFAWSNNL